MPESSGEMSIAVRLAKDGGVFLSFYNDELSINLPFASLAEMNKFLDNIKESAENALNYGATQPNVPFVGHG